MNTQISGPIIGQAINLLANSDGEFLTLLTTADYEVLEDYVPQIHKIAVHLVKLSTDVNDHVTKLPLNEEEFWKRAQTQYGPKLFQDFKCIVNVNESISLNVQKVYTENRETFVLHKADIQTSNGEIVSLTIPQSSYLTLKPNVLPKTYTLKSKFVDGNYGKRMVALWL